MKDTHEPEKNLRVEIGTKQATRHGSPITVTLLVEDRASGEWLCRVEMDANTLLDLITGSSYNLVGHVSQHLDRVGKQLEVEEVRVPREVTADVSRDDEHTTVEAWAAKQSWIILWEDVEMRRHNWGWGLILRRWNKPPVNPPTTMGQRVRVADRVSYYGGREGTVDKFGSETGAGTAHVTFTDAREGQPKSDWFAVDELVVIT